VDLEALTGGRWPAKEYAVFGRVIQVLAATVWVGEGYRAGMLEGEIGRAVSGAGEDICGA